MGKTWESWRPVRRAQRVIVWIATVVPVIAAILVWVQRLLADGEVARSTKFVQGVVVCSAAAVVGMAAIALVIYFYRDEQSQSNASDGMLSEAGKDEMMADAMKVAKCNAATNERLVVLVDLAHQRVAALETAVKAGDTAKAAALAEAKEWASLADEMHSRLVELGTAYTVQLASATFDLFGLNWAQAILFGPTAPFWETLSKNPALKAERPIALDSADKRVEDALRVIETWHKSREGIALQVRSAMESDIRELVRPPTTLVLGLEKRLESNTEADRSSESAS